MHLDNKFFALILLLITVNADKVDHNVHVFTRNSGMNRNDLKKDFVTSTLDLKLYPGGWFDHLTERTKYYELYDTGVKFSSIIIELKNGKVLLTVDNVSEFGKVTVREMTPKYVVIWSEKKVSYEVRDDRKLLDVSKNLDHFCAVGFNKLAINKIMNKLKTAVNTMDCGIITYINSNLIILSAYREACSVENDVNDLLKKAKSFKLKIFAAVIDTAIKIASVATLGATDAVKTVVENVAKIAELVVQIQENIELIGKIKEASEASEDQKEDIKEIIDDKPTENDIKPKSSITRELGFTFTKIAMMNVLKDLSNKCESNDEKLKTNNIIENDKNKGLNPTNMVNKEDKLNAWKQQGIGK
jgi:hypothetical protein